MKQIRQLRKISQEDLAIALGVVRQTIQKYECGEVKMQPEVIHHCAEVFKISIGYFYGEGVKARMLSTSIDYDDPSASLDIALSVIDDFRINKSRAQEIIAEVASAVKQWRHVAEQLGISKKEVDRMASAVEHEDMEKAKI